MNMDEKKQLITLAVVCGVFFCVELVVGWNLSTENSITRTKLEELEKRKVSAQTKLNTIPEMRKKAADLSEIVSDYTAILPEIDEVRRDAFVDTITTLCKDSGLTILEAVPVSTEVRKSSRMVRPVPGQVAVHPPFQRHKYRFEMQGEFSQFHRFINSVESHPRFLRVDGVELYPLDQGEGLSSASDPKKRLAIEISTYVYDEVKVSVKEIQ
ncbi:MAG: type 4a pilus biogenesis protein PilO [Planctomycetia bacterium]|nr:type 4a pilus biogenesis protein PilO [Planctomycetia bacterium]MBL6915631.1 type 4a pilus biogenesis protein PilO [Planctomycetota bacterium]HCW43817.1 hypothetical protein [Planctomycetota bacterium]